MIFVGRIDESDTHGNEPDMVMSAMLGGSDEWELLRRRLNAIRRDYGFSVFHGTEFRALTGEFAGWSEMKCRKLLFDLGKAVSGTLRECVTVTCEYATYRDHFLAKRPAKMHQTSQYGLCFNVILDTLTYRVAQIRGRHRLSVIVEAGHKNAPDTARIFTERKAAYQQQGMDFYRTHSLARKKDDPLLMLSDVTAYGSAREERVKRAGVDRPFTDSPGAEEPRGNETGWSVVEVTPKYISNLIEEFEAGKAAKHAEYLERRAKALGKQAGAQG